jgi:hypothetical protein
MFTKSCRRTYTLPHTTIPYIYYDDHVLYSLPYYECILLLTHGDLAQFTQFNHYESIFS